MDINSELIEANIREVESRLEKIKRVAEDAKHDEAYLHGQLTLLRGLAVRLATPVAPVNGPQDSDRTPF